MEIRPPMVTQAWIKNVFSSPPRRDIVRTTKATSRFPVRVPRQNSVFFAEGGNEHIALLLLRHLQSIGIVRRLKSQPFYLEELGGPARLIPDLLVELHDHSLHVIECKAKRFVTDEVQERFALEQKCLTQLGFGFHVWTNRDKLGQPVSGAVRQLDRGFNHPPEREVVETIRSSVTPATTLGDLFAAFGLDDVIGAAAVSAIHFDIRKELHETSNVTLHAPTGYKNHFFASGHVPNGWWASLST